MIKKFIEKLLGKSPSAKAKASKPKFGKREEVGVEAHGIDAKLVDERAMFVVRTLKDAGFEAYIVGGAVRDLMVGLVPKDFDVATNATPEQVKGLFRRAFIIGRRFRIVHVVHGRGRDHEVIEVSTFRAYLDAAAAEQVAGNEKTSRAELSGKSHVVDATGRVLRDNVWGPQHEDAERRDFTVNALYYDPRTQVVVDYHGGIADAKKRLLRMIGDPLARYREDPVRIVRAVRFAAKLGFEVEPKTRAPMKDCAALLEAVPASRLFDELFKLLQTGHSRASIEQLKKHGLLGTGTGIGKGERGIFPLLDAVLADAEKHPARAAFIDAALADTDRRVAESKSVAPSFLLACLLWHEVLAHWQRLKAHGEPPFPALQQAIDTVFDARVGDISGRGKLGADMREIWMMQPRFERRSGATPLALVDQPRFRAGFDFLRLRADCGEAPVELAEWWEDFSLGSDEERRALLEEAREREQQARRASGPSAVASGRTAAAHGNVASASGSAATAAGEAVADPAARKRRRRRRKPAGEGGASDDAAGPGTAALDRTG